MIFVWGSRLAGRVDEVPGVFYVAMRFEHLWYIPVIPRGTYLMFITKGDTSQGVKIPFRPLCWLLAYLRPALIFFGCLNIAMGATIASDSKLTGGAGEAVTGIVFGLAMLGAALWMWLSKDVRFASYTRAHELAERCALPEALRSRIDEAFGATTKQKIAELTQESSRWPVPIPVVVSLGLFAVYFLYFVVLIATDGP